MTIIGFERKKDGTANLLVFDPMFRDSTEVIKLIGKKFIHKNPPDLLRAYRRSVKYLRKYNEFEVMK
jgi:zinc finger-containing ubiquitin peptidase 1